MTVTEFASYRTALEEFSKRLESARSRWADEGHLSGVPIGELDAIKDRHEKLMRDLADKDEAIWRSLAKEFQTMLGDLTADLDAFMDRLDKR